MKSKSFKALFLHRDSVFLSCFSSPKTCFFGIKHLNSSVMTVFEYHSEAGEI